MYIEDYYNILGVSPASEDVVIKAAYKALLRKYHPDINSSADASDHAARINAAFEVLNDPDARAAYDEARSQAFVDNEYHSGDWATGGNNNASQGDQGSTADDRSKKSRSYATAERTKGHRSTSRGAAYLGASLFASLALIAILLALKTNARALSDPLGSGVTRSSDAWAGREAGDVLARSVERDGGSRNEIVSALAVVTNNLDREALEDGNELLTVEGALINPTSRTQDVPAIRAQLQNASGQVVYRWTIDTPVKQLAAGARAEFRSKVKVPPGGEELTIAVGA